MPTNITDTEIRDTYDQLLHIDGGPEVTEKVVHSAVGVATALKLGTGSASVDNLKLDGNTITATNTNGDISLVPHGSGTVNIPNITFGDPAQARSALNLGTAALSATGDFATAAQGALANSAVQPGEIGTLAAQNSDNVSITGGSIQDVNFTGAFTGITSITSQSFKATNDVGYTTGAGGTVTQITSRTTGVTLNKPSGQITLVAGSIAGLSTQEFTLTNSFIAATDVVLVSFGAGLTSPQYDVTVTATAAGSCKIAIHNVNNSATPTDTPVINFVVFKGVSS